MTVVEAEEGESSSASMEVDMIWFCQGRVSYVRPRHHPPPGPFANVRMFVCLFVCSFVSDHRT